MKFLDKIYYRRVYTRYMLLHCVAHERQNRVFSGSHVAICLAHTHRTQQTIYKRNAQTFERAMNEYINLYLKFFFWQSILCIRLTLRLSIITCCVQEKNERMSK